MRKIRNAHLEVVGVELELERRRLEVGRLDHCFRDPASQFGVCVDGVFRRWNVPRNTKRIWLTFSLVPSPRKFAVPAFIHTEGNPDFPSLREVVLVYPSPQPYELGESWFNVGDPHGAFLAKHNGGRVYVSCDYDAQA
jgi:hypothetical protein